MTSEMPPSLKKSTRKASVGHRAVGGGLRLRLKGETAAQTSLEAQKTFCGFGLLHARPVVPWALGFKARSGFTSCNLELAAGTGRGFGRIGPRLLRPGPSSIRYPSLPSKVAA